MTDPATYITGRTVQEQMNQLIGYVDTRSAEVAVAAIADDMSTLSQAVTNAQDAKDDAEAARDTAISTVSDCVKMTPAAAQTITGYGLTVSAGVTADVTGNITSAGTSAFNGTVTVPTVTTGTFDTKAANGTKVKNELDAYAPMVRTTDNQTIAGDKTFTGLTTLSQSRIAETGGSEYKKIYKMNITTRTQTLLFIGGRSIVLAQIGSGGGYKKTLATKGRDYTGTWMWVAKDTNGDTYLVTKGLYSATMNIYVINSFRYGMAYNYLDDISVVNEVISNEPVVGPDWTAVYPVEEYD